MLFSFFRIGSWCASGVLQLLAAESAGALLVFLPHTLAFRVTMRRLRPSMRAANASEAIVERIIATHLRPGIANLAPGTAHWSPPERLVEAALHGDGGYGDIRGEPALLAALREEHGREHVMVTPGANQAFVHALLSTCDVGDEVLLWRPYYFSHLVALQLLGLVPVFADCDERGEPTHDHSQHQCHQQCSLCSPLRVGLPTPDAVRASASRPGGRLRAVVLVSPSNPTGAVCPAELVRELGEACAQVRRVPSSVGACGSTVSRSVSVPAGGRVVDLGRGARYGEMWGDMGRYGLISDEARRAPSPTALPPALVDLDE